MSLSRARKYALLEDAVAETRRVPKCWLPDLIHSQMANGNFERIYTAAICWARHKKDEDSVRLFTHMHGQIVDYAAVMDDE